MYDTYKMQEHICKELEKKTEGGIKSTSDLDTVWKLIDSYKNLLKIDMLQEASEYSENGGYSQNDGYSERRRRDSRGRYSREGGNSYGGNSYEGESSYARGGGGGNRGGGSSRGGGYSQGSYSGYSEAKGEYMEAKQSYRSSRSPESKRDMNVSLEDCMYKLKEELQQMMSGADTREEREKFKEMIQEIGRLAN